MQSVHGHVSSSDDFSMDNLWVECVNYIQCTVTFRCWASCLEACNDEVLEHNVPPMLLVDAWGFKCAIASSMNFLTLTLGPRGGTMGY